MHATYILNSTIKTNYKGTKTNYRTAVNKSNVTGNEVRIS